MKSLMATCAFFALVGSAAPSHAIPCDLVREHRATIEAMDSRTKKTWIKRLKISKAQVRKAARCLR
jgi:hypothetical protein